MSWKGWMSSIRSFVRSIAPSAVSLAPIDRLFSKMATFSPPALRLLHLPVGRLLVATARRELPAAVQRRIYSVVTSRAQQCGSEDQPPASHLSLLATSPAATELLAEYFASDLQPGDAYLLYGSVGAGKSYFRCWRPGQQAKAACTYLRMPAAAAAARALR